MSDEHQYSGFKGDLKNLFPVIYTWACSKHYLTFGTFAAKEEGSHFLPTLLG